MIAQGTTEEIKRNLLNHVSWSPVKSLQAAVYQFDAEGLTITSTRLPTRPFFSELRFSSFSTSHGFDDFYGVRVAFKCDRTREQTLAKLHRAARRARLHVHMLWYRANTQEYTAELTPDA